MRMVRKLVLELFCEPILREVGRALFEILHTHPIPTDEN